MEKNLITTALVENVIRAYNSAFHTQYRYGNSDNTYAASLVLEAANDPITAISSVNNATCWHKSHADVPVPELCKLLAGVAYDIKMNGGNTVSYIGKPKPGDHTRWVGTPAPQHPAQQTPAPHPAETIVKEIKNMADNTQTINLLGAVLADVLKSMDQSSLEDRVLEKATKMLDKYIADTYGPITRKTTVVIGDKAKEVKGVVHEKFGEVLNYIANDEPVYLAGPAGTGKNFLVKQIADVLGQEFYFSNAVTQEYKITGFTDANGRYQESQFYKAFKNGGIFMLDEMDASIPEVLIVLNAAIANRYFDFPAPIGKVEAHKNFRVVAAGNTYGNGADYDYVGRSQLDAASMDRFGLVTIDYDRKIEEAMAQGNTDLLGFCRAFRKAAKDAGIKTVVSYRGISRMAKLDAALKPAELIQSCLTKGLDKQDIRTIKDKLTGYGKYSEAINSLI